MEEEFVEIMRFGGDFHIATPKFTGERRKIPVLAWKNFVTNRSLYLDSRQQIEVLFNPPRDKLMHVAKFHDL